MHFVLMFMSDLHQHAYQKTQLHKDLLFCTKLPTERLLLLQKFVLGKSNLFHPLDSARLKLPVLQKFYKMLRFINVSESNEFTFVA